MFLTRAVLYTYPSGEYDCGDKFPEHKRFSGPDPQGESVGELDGNRWIPGTQLCIQLQQLKKNPIFVSIKSKCHPVFSNKIKNRNQFSKTKTGYTASNMLPFKDTKTRFLIKFFYFHFKDRDVDGHAPKICQISHQNSLKERTLIV